MTPPYGGDCCAAGLLQTLLHALPSFLGATKGGTFTGAGQSTPRDLSPHKGLSRPPSNRRPALLVSWTDPSDRPLNSIFMLGGAPKAHEVYSKRGALLYCRVGPSAREIL